MNKDQISGKLDQATGKVKQAVGEAVGNENLANQGLADQAKGAAKETWGNAKDAASVITPSRDSHTRSNLSQTIDAVKERINEKIDAVREQHHQKDDRTA
jgi:uncharacterized protein YjbJ (UPF0337 family)